MTFSRDTVTLSWSPPVEGESTVTGYRIEMRELTRTRWDQVAEVDANDTSYTLRGLRTGASYVFRVMTVNAAGVSKPVTMDTAFIARTPYGE